MLNLMQILAFAPRPRNVRFGSQNLVCRPRQGALPCRDRSIWGVEILYISFALSKDANGEPIRAELWPDVRFREIVLQNYFRAHNAKY
jgi:hypothetical protein